MLFFQLSLELILFIGLCIGKSVEKLNIFLAENKVMRAIPDKPMDLLGIGVYIWFGGFSPCKYIIQCRLEYSTISL
jgi:hypothetical protein